MTSTGSTDDEETRRLVRQNLLSVYKWTTELIYRLEFYDSIFVNMDEKNIRLTTFVETDFNPKKG